MSSEVRRALLARYAARGAALVAIAVCYQLAKLPTLPASERASLASRFSFSQLALAEWNDGPRQTRRTVNPSLERHSGWISAVGAGVALADLDGDGLANDVCNVDPRSDRVTLAPVPGTGERYGLTTLEPVGLPYDTRTMAPMGCKPADMDEDGRVDLLVYYWGRTPVKRISTSLPGVRPDSRIRSEARSTMRTGSPMSRMKISPPRPSDAASRMS